MGLDINSWVDSVLSCLHCRNCVFLFAEAYFTKLLIAIIGRTSHLSLHIVKTIQRTGL
jgi:hypothetical protein